LSEIDEANTLIDKSGLRAAAEVALAKVMESPDDGKGKAFAAQVLARLREARKRKERRKERGSNEAG